MSDLSMSYSCILFNGETLYILDEHVADIIEKNTNVLVLEQGLTQEEMIARYKEKELILK